MSSWLVSVKRSRARNDSNSSISFTQSPRTVENLAQEAHLTVANTSRHLQILRAAHLIEAEKEGVFVRYRIADEAVVDFFRVPPRFGCQPAGRTRSDYSAIL